MLEQESSHQQQNQQASFPLNLQETPTTVDVDCRCREPTPEMRLPSFGSLASIAKALPKVELHLHLDGAMRPATLYEFAITKGFPVLPSWIQSASDFASFLVMRDEGDLPEFLDKFRFMTPQIAGDAHAISRVAFELCEDKKKEGVVYFEARYAPHLLMTPETRGSSFSSSSSCLPSSSCLSFDGVVEAVNAGLKAGQTQFGIGAKSILCCMRGDEGAKWASIVAEAALKYRQDGVVGIDLAGNESLPEGGVTKQTIAAFQYAKDNQIPITIHAGEAGPASNVKQAVEVLHAQRIGHGYHVLDDSSIYSSVVQRRGIHLEQCPFSSVKTGAFDLKSKGWPHHPLVQFYRDGVSFSINTDDPTVTGHSLNDEYSNVISSLGMQLTANCLVDSVRFATEAAFVAGDEKTKLRTLVDQRLQLIESEMFVEETSSSSAQIAASTK